MTINILFNMAVGFLVSLIISALIFLTIKKIMRRESKFWNLIDY